MKKVLVSVVFFLSFPSILFAHDATSREYPYIYKSPRAMGMGGAYIAIGGGLDTLFYNPAGLSTMPLKKGWEVNLINLSGEIGENVIDFVEDMQDAFDTGDMDRDGDEGDDQLRAVNDVLARYRGKNLHLRLADFTSFGRNFESLAFGIGGLGSLRLDMMTHQGYGPEGFLEVNTDAVYGGIGGFSIRLKEGLYAGIGIKALHRESLIHSFSARELVEKEDNLEDYILEELKKSGDAVGFDAGIIYHFAEDSSLRPSLGLSILNIGDLKFGEAGKMPMTVNTGFAIRPEIPLFEALTIGLDYVDIFNNYREDSDIPKRLRFGGELLLFDRMLAMLALRTGLYQGYPTFGVDLRLLIFRLSYVTYAEEVGAYAGQDPDRRHLVTLTVGW